MSNKEQSPSHPQPILTGYYPMYSEPKNDEIDLFQLIGQLWRKKWWIVGCMFLTTSIAGIYAFTAKEQWTATAIVDVPSFNTISNYYQGVRLIEGNQIKISTPDEVAERLFKQFISQLASYNELSKFINQSDYFKSLTKDKSKNEITQIFNEIVNGVKIVKNKDNLDYSISFPARTPEQAKKLLDDYVDAVNNYVSSVQYSQLTSQIANRKSVIQNQMEALRTIAKEKREEEIKNIKMALVIAEKANIQKPQLNGLTRLDSTNLFLLGADALSVMSESMISQPLVLNEQYYDYQQQYINLDNFKVNGELAQAYSYLKNPTIPSVKDKPARAFLLVLGAFLGLILASIIVVSRDLIKNN